jgi:hypothetical protein
MKIPETDSIRELAAFWDSHDVTEFPNELVEVAAPVFVHGNMSVMVPLSSEELESVREMAQSSGLDEAELIRSWVQEKLHR